MQFYVSELLPSDNFGESEGKEVWGRKWWWVITGCRAWHRAGRLFSTPQTGTLFCGKEWVLAVVFLFPMQIERKWWFPTGCMQKRPLGTVRTLNHLSDHISDTYLRRHLHQVLHFISGRWPGSKNNALAGLVTMQILTLCQPVTRGRILFQVLQFHSRRLLLQPAVADPRCSDPPFWMARWYLHVLRVVLP